MPTTPSLTPADFLRIVGQRVAVYRIIKNMPLDDLAVVTGFTVGQLEAFERGEFDVKISAIQAMAESLDTTVFDVLAVF